MKSRILSLPSLCLTVACVLPLSGCMTSNLIDWAQDEPSVYNEPEGEVSRSAIKPLFTIIGFPIAIGWDIATFPFQFISGSHPYGDSLMTPDTDVGM